MTDYEKDHGIHEGHRERLREKFLAGGHFQPHELLELLLTYSIPRINTNEIAHHLMNHFGSIDAIFSADVTELQEVAGIGEKSAILIRLASEIYDSFGADTPHRIVLDSVGKLGRYAVMLFRGMKKEAVYTVLLDAELRVNDCVRLAGGSMSRVKIDMQRVLKLTSARKSAAVAILHNHPDGLADPSEEDMEFVSRITELFHLMGLEVIEHIIVAGEEYRALMADKNRRSREL